MASRYAKRCPECGAYIEHEAHEPGCPLLKQEDGEIKVEVQRFGSLTLVRQACSFTSGKKSGVTEADILACEHSPMRLMRYWIKMYNIPSFVSTHLVRHNVGIDHFVKSNRDDRGGNGKEDRNTPVNHAMMVNAQSLINLCRKRLCKKSHIKTREVVEKIKEALINDPIYPFLIPECEYRGGWCHELKGCGLYPSKTL